ncbi:MAG: hypothetical protein DI598_03685 [Pseudopedobacter saltans]|uniref:CCDC81-like prokaryotic HU domain-containing protein n=1 Tax=Pseudopedobacter saltans TaxID=151895 RepID=A0A2W5GZJ8_9SPHI|nr:MAG: hypothetical protein DI598_03685 [Pseudopedobacter saltans]
MERIYPLLYQYLLSNKILLLPKIGTFSLSSVGARYDYPTQSLQAPSMDFTFQGSVNSKKNDQHLYSYLGNTLSDTQLSAEQEIDDFAEKILQKLQEDGNVLLPGIGTLRILNEKIILDGSYDPKMMFPDQSALPVKRENANTKILSGDTEYTKREMENILDESKKKKNWWVYLLIAVLILGVAAGIYYYMMKMQNKI